MPADQIPHVYGDGGVTPARVRAFADAPTDVQLAALTELRKRSVEAAGIQIASMALSFAILLGIAALLWDATPALQTEADYIELPGFTVRQSALIMTGVLLVLITLMLGALSRIGRAIERRASGAAALLRAYEDELTRRHAASGREARRWQRAHRVEWGRPGQ